jgi:predicted transglutaminase-like cysteine proteinase
MSTQRLPLAKSALIAAWVAAAALGALKIHEIAVAIPAIHERLNSSADATGYSRSDFLKSASQLGGPGKLRARAFADAIETAKLLPREAQAQAEWASAVNARLFEYGSDLDVWGLQDYWATPLEFAEKGRGDCEDFAIAARALLYASGFPKNRLAMAYARLDSNGLVIPHMVLLVRDGSESWVIDNTRTEATKLSERPDLEVVFTYDETNVFLRVAQKNVGSSRQRLPLWNDLLLRSAQIGFR